MGTVSGLPRSARMVMAGVFASGLACLAIRAHEVATWTAKDALTLAGLVVAGVLAEQFNISIRHRTETENFMLTDAVWVPALLLGKPGVLTCAVVLTTLLGQPLKRWAWYKILFNAAQFAVAITVAEVIHGAIPGAGAVGLTMWTSAIVSMAAFFLVNEVLIALIIACVEHERLSKVLVLPAGLNLFHAAANVTIGMIATLVWSTGPAQLPLVLAPVLLSFLAYRGWFQSNQEEQKSKELMRTLYEASAALLGRVDMRFDFKPFLSSVARMLNASLVQLVLFEGDTVLLHTSEGDVLTAQREPGRNPADHLVPRADETTTIAPVTAEGEEIGALAVRRRPSLSPSEASLVEALAAQVSTKEENEHLFHRAEDQRVYLADVIANSSDGIFVIGSDLAVRSWNPAMERITRFTREEAVGHPIAEVLRARVPADDAAYRARASGPEEPAPLSFVPGSTQAVLIARQDGSERWIRYATNAMRGEGDGDGSAGSFVVVARDVTAEVEADRLKSDFVATVSHELRTPLTPLKGFLTTLASGDREMPEEARRESYEIMLRQTDRLERLIGDLLDVARLDSGRVPIEPTLVDLRSFLPEHVEDALRQPGGRPIELSIPREPVWVRADPFRVSQVVANLLSNAFKYSGPDAAVRVVLSTAQDRAMIAVHDEGPGIPIEEQPRVFDRFYRIDNSTTRTTGGAGLGLYIAKRLADAMGGELTLASRPGKGCSFVLALSRIDPALMSGIDGSARAG